MLHSWKTFFALTLAAVSACDVLAQQKESLLIGPGDLIQIHVFDTPELDQMARVTDAGTFPLTLGGEIKISSHTPAEASHTVEEVLASGHYLLHPRVSVTVADYATQKVSVLGEVRAPGAYAIGTPRLVNDVLALAGGLTELADRRIAIQRRGSHERISCFVTNSIAFDSGVAINPGDTIFVPKAGVVYILGDVGRPGGYTMTNNDAEITVLQLVARAGGTNHSAVPSKARLIRRTGASYNESPLPLSQMQKGKTPDLKLEANDIVYVPFSFLRTVGMQAAGVVGSLGSAAIYQF